MKLLIRLIKNIILIFIIYPLITTFGSVLLWLINCVCEAFDENRYISKIYPDGDSLNLFRVVRYWHFEILKGINK